MPSQFPHDSFGVNPYAAPPGGYHQPPLPPADSITVTIFAVLNCVLALLALVWTGFIGLALIYGIFYSGDQGAELAAGVLGSLFIGSPGAIGLIVYTVAGIGLLKRRSWGYYCHLAGAALAALSCVGVVYTIVAIVFAMQPEFKNACTQT